MVHKNLEVWQLSMELVTTLYEVTRVFPKDEIYGITSQIRRAAVSIPTNISEGAARNHTKEYIQFLYIALGSASEVETLIQISKNLGYLTETKEIENKLDSVRRLLAGLIKYLSSTRNP